MAGCCDEEHKRGAQACAHAGENNEQDYLRIQRSHHRATSRQDSFDVWASFVSFVVCAHTCLNFAIHGCARERAC